MQLSGSSPETMDGARHGDGADDRHGSAVANVHCLRCPPFKTGGGPQLPGFAGPNHPLSWLSPISPVWGGLIFLGEKARKAESTPNRQVPISKLSAWELG